MHECYFVIQIIGGGGTGVRRPYETGLARTGTFEGQ